MRTLCLIFLFSFIELFSCDSKYSNNVIVSFINKSVTCNEGDVIEIYFNISTVDHSFEVDVTVEDKLVARKINCTYASTSQDVGNLWLEQYVCEIEALRLGQTKLLLHNQSNILDEEKVETSVFNDEFLIKVLHPTGVKDVIFRVITILLVLVLNFCIGCGLYPEAIIRYLKKPLAPAVGFSSQFVMMPLVAFGFSKLTQIEPAFGFALFVSSCCPGGGASNVWTVLLSGDLDLSMTMTFLSTVASIGLLPLWIYLLGRYYIDTDIVNIPYGMIAVNVIPIVFPVLAGILLKWKMPNIAEKIHRLSKVFAAIFIIYILTYGTYANLYIYKLIGDYPVLLPIGACLPWLGLIFGFSIGMLLRQGYKRSITIALETGIQNVGISILVLLYAIPEPEGALGVLMPVIISVFTPIPLYICLIVFKCVMKRSEHTPINKETVSYENFSNDAT